MRSWNRFFYKPRSSSEIKEISRDKSAEVIVGIYGINKEGMTAEFLILHFAVGNSIFYIFKNKRQIIHPV